MQSNTVVWFEVYVNDMQRAKAFYESVLEVHSQNRACHGYRWQRDRPPFYEIGAEFEGKLLNAVLSDQVVDNRYGPNAKTGSLARI